MPAGCLSSAPVGNRRFRGGCRVCTGSVQQHLFHPAGQQRRGGRRTISEEEGTPFSSGGVYSLVGGTQRWRDTDLEPQQKRVEHVRFVPASGV